MARTINWRTYTFEIHSPDAPWSDVGGVYIFSGPNSEGKWVPLYIGQASSLAERLATHERWSEAQSLGATHIHAAEFGLQSDRDVVEAELIQHYKPRLNVHLK